MTNYQAKRSASSSASRRTSASSASTKSSVSTARLSQKTGSSNSFGGYEKAQAKSGNFYMRKTK